MTSGWICRGTAPRIYTAARETSRILESQNEVEELFQRLNTKQMANVTSTTHTIVALRPDAEIVTTPLGECSSQAQPRSGRRNTPEELRSDKKVRDSNNSLGTDGLSHYDSALQSTSSVHTEPSYSGKLVDVNTNENGTGIIVTTRNRAN